METGIKSVEGRIVDIDSCSIFEGSLHIQDGRIVAIKRHPTTQTHYITVGLVDAHVHIESSMLTPAEFGRLVVEHGTIGVVTDPHEIANVMGVEGVDFMVESSKSSPIRTFFSIPSSVPATPFDVAGGEINSLDVRRMAASGQFVALSEVMNVPGVLSGDKEVISKLEVAREFGLPIDGHAPLILASELEVYSSQGITTDHECVSLDEAQMKIASGMKILIRWGSAAYNYQALKPLIASNPRDVMFCTDDLHPDDLLESGDIDRFLRQGVADGFDLFELLRIASINPIEHYNLPLGVLREGDSADFMVVDNLIDFNVKQLYVAGEKRFDSADGVLCEEESLQSCPNNFNHEPILVEELSKAVSGEFAMIGIIPNELVTNLLYHRVDESVDNLESIPSADIAKVVYVNRYQNGTPQISYLQGCGITQGAFASSVGHDSHNIVAVGCSDEELQMAINAVIEHRGALSVAHNGECATLPLPIGGIISPLAGREVAQLYKELDSRVKSLGCTLNAPFMTLAFLSLLVIPHVKIGERGLFALSRFDWLES
ncbi:MAG: adenine deaminase [Rikenellaceae bacterium]